MNKLALNALWVIEFGGQADVFEPVGRLGCKLQLFCFRKKTQYLSVSLCSPCAAIGKMGITRKFGGVLTSEALRPGRQTVAIVL